MKNIRFESIDDSVRDSIRAMDKKDLLIFATAINDYVKFYTSESKSEKLYGENVSRETTQSWFASYCNSIYLLEYVRSLAEKQFLSKMRSEEISFIQFSMYITKELALDAVKTAISRYDMMHQDTLKKLEINVRYLLATMDFGMPYSKSGTISIQNSYKIGRTLVKNA